jgi:hypothetical protein
MTHLFGFMTDLTSKYWMSPSAILLFFAQLPW